MYKKKFIKKNKIKTEKQIKIINRATNRAIKQIEKERRVNQARSYFDEWFRYVELTSTQLQKYLN
tara:strand:+ start:329 stop:523 length:195 start_codon:yes stop_codon:yes gene_type:complete